MTETREEILKALEARVPQLRYAFEFNDSEFGLKHLRHLETIISENLTSETTKINGANNNE